MRTGERKDYLEVFRGLGVAVGRIVIVGDESVADEEVRDVLREHLIDSVLAQHVVGLLVDAHIQVVILVIGSVRIDVKIHAVVATLHNSVGLRAKPSSTHVLQFVRPRFDRPQTG